MVKGTNHATERDDMLCGAICPPSPVEVFSPDMDSPVSTKPEIRVFEAGSTVRIGPQDAAVDGVVTEVCIFAGNRVVYRVSWWNGRQRCNEYLKASEITSQGPKQRIGFMR